MLRAHKGVDWSPYLNAGDLLFLSTRIDPARWPVLPCSGDTARNIFMIDPLGNLILRYPADPDIKRMANDLGRLLRASRIG